MFDMVQKSLRDWKIEDKIFSFTLDNASVNTSMVGHLRKKLADRYLLHHSGKLLHVRCAAHVLNLVVQDGLDAMASVVDRIRDLVQYVRSSQGRMEKFNAMIGQVGLACKNHPSLDVPTRWNSTYLMLESSLPFIATFEVLKEAGKDYKFLLQLVNGRWQKLFAIFWALFTQPQRKSRVGHIPPLTYTSMRSGM